MKNKKNMLLSIIAITTLLVLVVGATYAYFIAQTGTGAGTDVNVTTSTTDTLTFSTDGEISINATQQNFGKGAGNISDYAIATATLKSNNATNSATDNYYLYLEITENDFVYTTENETAELILTVEGPEAPLTEIDGLEYVTVGDVSGFDVTTSNGIITIANLYEITATTYPGIHEWEVILTFVNLDSDQQENTGKTFTAELIIQKEAKTQLLADFIISKYGTDENLYYHDENLEGGAGDNSYRYAGANPNNYVYIEGEYELLRMRIIGVFDGYVKLIFDDFIHSDTMTEDASITNTPILSSSYSNYKGNIEKIGGVVWGNTPKWDDSNVNLSLNLQDALNMLFLGGEIDFINLHQWKMAEGEAAEILANARTSYDAELGDYANVDTVEGHFGLMYVSEYAYATSPDYWEKNLYSNYSAAAATNWMYMGIEEWTMTVNTEENADAFILLEDGHVNSEISYGGCGGGISCAYPIRPTFYLNLDVEYLGGKGTYNEPFMI